MGVGQVVGAFCFDLGGTLIDRDRATGLRTHWAACGRRIEAKDAEAAVYRTDRLFMEHHPDLWRNGGDAFHLRYWGRVHAELGLQVPPLDVCARWGGPWRVYGDALAALRRLRHAGYPLALLSNWDETAPEVLAATGLAGSFDVVGISAQLGREKPDPETFAWVADALDLPPERITHIGDNAWDDALGAFAAGMTAVLVHRHPEWQALPALPGDITVVSDLGSAVPYLLHRAGRALAYP